MTESTTTRGKRPRRSTRISQRLERVRQRNADQLAEQRAREERVETALGEFVEAGDAIATEEHACEEKVATYQRKIDELRSETQQKVADQHARQAQAALAIHEAGRTVDQVAELLELRSEKEARRLIAAGREAADPDTSSESPVQPRPEANGQTQRDAVACSSERAAGSAVPEHPRPASTGSGEQAHLGGVDAQQHRSHTGFVPAVADGGGQSV
ncbi:hypothetical protein [Parasphingorhabdus pacifica]